MGDVRHALAVNHIAIAMPGREAWLAHLEYMQTKGVKFDSRLEHGMTHSLYIHDPNGYGVECSTTCPGNVEGRHQRRVELAKALPTEGPEALEDRTEGLPTFRQSAPAAEDPFNMVLEARP